MTGSLVHFILFHSQVIYHRNAAIYGVFRIFLDVANDEDFNHPHLIAAALLSLAFTMT
jgi:hypothetical protein